MIALPKKSPFLTENSRRSSTTPREKLARLHPSTIITPQTRFLAACSYLPKSAAGLRHQSQLLESASATPLQPEALWEGIQRHRIFALAERVLRTHSLLAMLGPFETALASRAQQAQLESLELFGESLRLSSLLSKHSIEHHFLKGPLLAKKIYGDPGLRHTHDLDVQVRANDISAAITLLQADHWTPVVNTAMWQRHALYRWIAERRLRHLKFVHKQKRRRLELHWRIEQSHTPTLDRLWWTHWAAGADPAAVSHAEVLHLCMHGAAHAWSRLKWIGDLQAILDCQPDLWNETLSLNRELGLEVIVAQTISLLYLLFDSKPAAQASDLTQYALECMQFKTVKFNGLPSDTISYRRYLLTLNNRLHWQARVADFLGLCLVDGDDLETWPRSAAALPAIPLIRAYKLVSRYCFNRKPSLNAQHPQVLHG